MERIPQRTPAGELELLEDESVGMRVDKTSLDINGKDAGRGTLYATTQRVAWLSDTETSFAISYVNIVLHALSSDPQASARPCLYCQIKGDSLPLMADGQPFGVAVSDSEETAQDADDSASYEAMIEIKFIPDDSNCLSQLFSTMSDMAALHPDPDAADLDGDEEELFDEATLKQQGWEFVENEKDEAASRDVAGDET